MAAVDIFGQLVQQVALVGNPLGAVIPKMMVRVANWYIRLQRFFLPGGEPVIASEWHNQASCAYHSAGQPRYVTCSAGSAIITQQFPVPRAGTRNHISPPATPPSR